MKKKARRGSISWGGARITTTPSTTTAIRARTAKNSPATLGISAKTAPRKLSVIGDIACDPDSDYNPVPVYDRATSWEAPALRAHDDPPLDVMAIDNLPSLLPVESSEDFAAQLLPSLMTLDNLETGVWGRAKATFSEHVQGV